MSQADFTLLEPPGFRNELEVLVSDVTAKADEDSRTALTIVELDGGGWSGDAPADRENGANPIQFIPLNPDNPTDPADGTFGIATPANIRSWDRLGPVTVDTL